MGRIQLNMDGTAELKCSLPVRPDPWHAELISLEIRADAAADEGEPVISAFLRLRMDEIEESRPFFEDVEDVSILLSPGESSKVLAIISETDENSQCGKRFAVLLPTRDGLVEETRCCCRDSAKFEALGIVS